MRIDRELALKRWGTLEYQCAGVLVWCANPHTCFLKLGKSLGWCSPSRLPFVGKLLTVRNERSVDGLLLIDFTVMLAF